MKTHSVVTRAIFVGLGCSVALAIAGAAAAETVPIEAEGRQPLGHSLALTADVFMSSPLLIKDSPAASSGSYVEVAPGNDSLNAPPVREGLARYNFRVESAGTYRIWARVMAPTTGDDSFWIRINDLESTQFGDPHVSHEGAWIKWNNIPLGAAWHWVLVKGDAATAVEFSLLPNDDPNNPPDPAAMHAGHQLELGYREAGTRVDVFLISSDPNFDPRAPLTAPPAAPNVQDAVPGANAHLITWMTVPGATSYVLERQDSLDFPSPALFQVLRAGLTGHSFVDLAPPPSAAYRVRAVASTGTSAISPDFLDTTFASRRSSDGNPQLVRMGSNQLSVTAPLVNDGSVYAPIGTDSVAAPPAHGRGRLDFQVSERTKVKIWANVVGLELTPIRTDRDSFWVRMDDGPWIKWNNIKDWCDDVHNSDDGGRPMIYDLAPGSHRYEFAPREGGIVLNNRIVVSARLDNVEQCSD
jgi:hypothetical protein